VDADPERCEFKSDLDPGRLSEMEHCAVKNHFKKYLSLEAVLRIRIHIGSEFKEVKKKYQDLTIKVAFYFFLLLSCLMDPDPDPYFY
jgi:hypothetical protein